MYSKFDLPNSELRWEIREISISRKRTPRKIHRIKNHSIRITIIKEIKERNEERKFDGEEREID